MGFASGKTASITIAASARPYDQFDLKFKSEIIDTTNFSSSGYQANVAGIFSADCSFSGPYDQAEGYAQGDSVSIIFTTGGSAAFTVVIRISEVGISTAARNKADQISASGTSNGVYTITI